MRQALPEYRALFNFGGVDCDICGRDSGELKVLGSSPRVFSMEKEFMK